MREHCQKVSKEKRKAFKTESYWGLPVEGFGDPDASFWIVGLAPAAHGANRTGRVFTGDESGKFLYRALHRFGYANINTSTHRSDSLELKDAYISCIVRCAPPENKPTTEETKNCSSFLFQELSLLKNLRTVLALGRLAYDQMSKVLTTGELDKRPPPFKHGVQYKIQLHNGKQILLIGSYHVSQQNTFTGKLTESMFDEILQMTLKKK